MTPKEALNKIWRDAYPKSCETWSADRLCEHWRVVEKALNEHEALKRDIARYFELAPNVAKRLYETQPDEEVNFDDLDALYGVKNAVFPYTGVYKEYIELKDKLSKVGK